MDLGRRAAALSSTGIEQSLAQTNGSSHLTVMILGHYMGRYLVPDTLRAVRPPRLRGVAPAA